MKASIMDLIDTEIGKADDNLARANACFEGMDNQQLDKPYGQSGQSCKQILQGHKDWKAKGVKMKEWLNMQDVW